MAKVKQIKNDGLTCNQRYYRTKGYATSADRVNKWRQVNPERARELSRQSYAKHAVKRREAKREYDHTIKLAQNKTESGRLAVRLAKQRRRTALRDGALTAQEWLEILGQYDGKCAYCGSADRIEIDHVLPLSKGGRHTKGNVVPACKPCNTSRGNRHQTPPRLKEAS